MQNPRLASRYAKSLLDLAVERNSLEATLKDMRTLNEICAISHDFEVMLRSPVIKGDKKLSVISAVLKNQNIGELTNAFITLLVNKSRERNLPEITEAFIGQYNRLNNIRTVKLTTATAMNDTIRKGIEAKISGHMPKDTINLETAIDESLIGGFVLEVEDQLFDASVKKSLNDIKNRLVDHSYENKL
jgi:F-type H+-transporting ATPase subunit delta